MKASVAGQDTRSQLISAAERLFAERGVDGVSLNEINRDAGQRNASALQYHFSDRAGLLKAIMDKHGPDVDARRDVLLQQYRDAGQADLRALAAALVLPVAAKLSDPDGGREFLRIFAELVNRPDPQFDVLMNEAIGVGILTWRECVDPLLSRESVEIFHTRFAAIRFTHVELAARAAARPRADDRLFTSRLIDLVAAVLASPVSDQTTELLRQRNTRRRLT
ncbi:helix-turn-helix domain-containing protein [Mycobacterium sp. AZCC_0083]|uniref:TetR/AcrR family transcriptional regulator n=1 Tax=Mycobacterium sp. AZCC_0083 TaxID=2735882 RepID=UPI0017B6C71E|nr:helix-turn-helix domain-containing protein [Mycobacterium sp. AZCC_0083]MBB5167798.1 AcrR family transcriptional regulator [Mycobacterium sp. AZCC_0083]